MLDQIILGDSIEIIKDIEENSIDAIISDIPYGINYEDWDILHNNTNSALGGSTTSQKNAGKVFKRRGKPLNGWSNSDKNISKEYQEWCLKWSYNWLKVLKPGSSCFIFSGRRYAHRCIIALEDSGFTFKDMLSWEKETSYTRAQKLSEIYKRRNDLVNYEKYSGWRVANLSPIFEPILWFQKPYKINGTLADNMLEYGVGAWNEEALRKYNIYSSHMSNIIKVKSNKEDHGLHETQKPLKLMELLISLVTTENSIILDPFTGSGTTCVAAKKLNRRYIGIEMNKKYVDIANNRLKNMY